MDTPFPNDVEQFDKDERISFSRLDNKFIAVHDDGTEYEWDSASRRWSRMKDEEEALGAEDRHEYGGAPSVGPGTEPVGSKKRKNGEEAAAAAKPARPAKRPKQNTAVYVTGLPLDVTVDEVHEVFSRKAGVVAEEIDSGAPRIKLYEDSQGKFKGDALIVFFKPQSVDMAVMLLDDTDFRITANGTREGRMRVQAADSSYKRTQYDQDDNGADRENSAQTRRQPQERRSQHRERDRQKVIRKTQKLDAKLADWSDDEEYLAQAQAATSRWNKIVILRHMFTLQELEDDPAVLLEIKEDIRDECTKLGTVTNLVLFDQEPDGIVSVKFREPEAAEACMKLMDGRSFDGRVVEATLATGSERFRRSKGSTEGAEDEPKEE